jgi:AraC-like DNA-binding protein
MWEERLVLYSPEIKVGALYFNNDERDSGKSIIHRRVDSSYLFMDYELKEGFAYPYVQFGLQFNPGAINLEVWDSVVVEIIADAHEKDVKIYAESFLENHTNPAEQGSFQFNQRYIKVSSEWQRISFPVKDFATPSWWARQQGDFPRDLHNVQRIGFQNSVESLPNQQKYMAVRYVELVRFRRVVIYYALIALVLIWSVQMILFWRGRVSHLVRHAEQEGRKEALFRSSADSAPAKKQEKDILIQTIKDEFRNSSLSMEEVTAKTMLSQSKVQQIVRENFGMTFKQLLNEMRLQEAARLLRESDQQIAEIAYEVGYNSDAYFNRVFRKKYECTPSEYRVEKYEEH